MDRYPDKVKGSVICCNRRCCPGDKNIFDILQDNNVAYSAAGENIAYISSPSSASPDLFFNMWMNSDAHRANILNSNFTHVGIGISSNNEKIIAVLVFLN
jgi:uncharacterized protein YkwD